MSEQYFAIVFTKDFPPGEHWTDHLRKRQPGEAFAPGKLRADDDDSDRRQHWRAGDLFSVGTVIADPLPAHLEAIPIPNPPGDDEQWDAKARAFVKRPAADLHAQFEPLAARLRAAGYTVTPPAHG